MPDRNLGEEAKLLRRHLGAEGWLHRRDDFAVLYAITRAELDGLLDGTLFVEELNPTGRAAMKAYLTAARAYDARMAEEEQHQREARDEANEARRRRTNLKPTSD